MYSSVDISVHITGSGNEAITLADNSVTATNIKELTEKTTGTIDANNVQTITGSMADILEVYEYQSILKVSGLGNEAITLNDTGSVTARDIKALTEKTNGTINANNVQTITGSMADILTVYEYQSNGKVSGLGNEAITLDDAGAVTASDIKTLFKKTGGTITAGVASK